MLLGTFIYPYFASTKRDHLVSHPKFYFFDIGITNFIAGKETSVLRGGDVGKMFEHYIYMELYAHKQLNFLQHNINYWRTKSGHEVDFVLKEGLIAIECKISDSIQKRDLAGLLSFKKDFPQARLYVVCLESSIRITTVDNIQIKIYPIKNFLQELWSGMIV